MVAVAAEAPAVAPPPTATVLTSALLRNLTLSLCPVPGCVKKPDGFKSKQALKFHMQSHPPADLVGVDTTAPLASGRAALPPGPYHCDQPSCAFGVGKKTLKNFKTAQQHSMTHVTGGDGAPVTTYACPTCSKSFALRYRLTEHSKACGKKEFRCKCGLSMAHKSSLKTHIAQWGPASPDLHYELKPARGAAHTCVAGVFCACGLHAVARGLDACRLTRPRTHPVQDEKPAGDGMVAAGGAEGGALAAEPPPLAPSAEM